MKTPIHILLIYFDQSKPDLMAVNSKAHKTEHEIAGAVEKRSEVVQS